MDDKSNQRKKRKPLPKPGRTQSFAEAKEATLKQFAKTFERLAQYEPPPSDAEISEYAKVVKESRKANPASKKKMLPRPGKHESIEEAMDATNKQYGQTLSWLAREDAREHNP